MDHSRQHADRPAPVGVALPSHYSVQEMLTLNGQRYRAEKFSWLGTIRLKIMDAVNDAWDHHYVDHGDKPHLRVTVTGVTDILTGHSVLHRDVKAAGQYGAAFRLRAERMRGHGDACLHDTLSNRMEGIACLFDEIAQRLESRRLLD